MKNTIELPKIMRVAMYYSNNDIQIQEMPIPEINDGEILVRIEASGICGSDVMEWYRRNKVPLVLGHEIAGTIVKVGKNVRKYKVGERVTVAHHVPCDSCEYCLKGHQTVCETLRKTNFYPGGFAEYIRVPAINVEKGVFLIPNGISFEEASFTEPVACVLRAQRIIGVEKNDCVLVIGSGVSGIIHIHFAKKVHKVRKVIATDINEFRLKMAKKFGADYTFTADEDIPQKVKSVNDNKLADKVIICTGNKEAMIQALRSVDRGGKVLFFAPTDQEEVIPFSVNEVFWRTEITLTSSYAGSPQDYQQALDLISNGQLNVKEMITHRFGLANILEGFKLVIQPKESLKVIIEPQK